MSWVNICDVPLESDYRFAIIKGLVTMFIIFSFGVLIGRISKKDANHSHSEKSVRRSK